MKCIVAGFICLLGFVPGNVGGHQCYPCSVGAPFGDGEDQFQLMKSS